MFRRNKDRTALSVYYDFEKVYILLAKTKPELELAGAGIFDFTKQDDKAALVKYFDHLKFKPRKIRLVIPQSVVVEKIFETNLSNDSDIELYIKHHQAEIIPDFGENYYFDFIAEISAQDKPKKIKVIACDKEKIQTLIALFCQARLNIRCIAIENECLARFATKLQQSAWFSEFVNQNELLSAKPWQICMGLLLRDSYVERNKFVAVAV